MLGSALICFGACVATAQAAPSTRTAVTPKVGVYKGVTSQGKPIAFRIAVALCPPQERGGNQHQRTGYCYQPVGEVLVIDNCADKTPATSDYPLFAALLTPAGKVSMPEISSDGSSGSFHLTVSANGTASGTLSQKEKAFSPVTNTQITCPSGTVTFKLHLR
jgi:hypothetical protein